MAYRWNIFTRKFDLVDGGGTVINELPETIGSWNMMMSYSAGTTTIQGADGNALSPTNPAIITLPSNTVLNTLVTHEITSNYEFDDASGASSAFINSLFSFSTGDDTNAGGGSPIPFFIYVSLDSTDANPVFWVSRVPNFKLFKSTTVFNAGSGLADLGRTGLTLKSVTTTDYENSSCTLVGTFDASMNGLDDWVIENVEDFISDIGMGRFAQVSRAFPRGVMGARAGSYFMDNGGTAPTINTGTQFAYLIEKSGRFNWDISMIITGTPAGEVEARLIRPLVGFPGTTLTCIGTWASEIAGLHVTRDLISVEGSGTPTPYFFFNKMDGSASRMQYAELEASDVFRMQLSWNL